MTNDNRKSDSCIVSKKPANKPVPETGAELVEKRRLAEGNELEEDKSRTPSRKEGWSVFKRIRLAAKQQRLMTSLYHVVYDEAQLRAAYFQLKRKAAAGIDGVTWSQYGEQLGENLKALAERLARKAYRPPAVRRVKIPKPDGRQRALGILTVADKVVQYVVACLLTAIWEREFLGFSYAYRPHRSVHDALDALTVGLMRQPINWILDADIRAFFDTISHEWLKQFIEYRVGDKRLVALIEKWLQAGVMVDGSWQASEIGTPQGGVISPVLANIYLHYVFDQWANQWRKRRARGAMIMVRYADDIVVGFEHREEAEQFRQELGARLAQFSLALNEDKTRLIEFGRQAARRRKQRGEGKPETFNFLGFTHICGQTRKGKFQVIRHTMRKRMQAKLKELKQEMRQRMHQRLQEQGEWIAAVLRGHYQHYGVPLNRRALASFTYRVSRLWYRTLRRRSQKAHTLGWEKFKRITARWTPAGHIHHPYPFVRLAKRMAGVVNVA